MRKFIADTNVLIDSPEILNQYNVVIPSHVNREIESLELTRKGDRTLQWKIRRFKRLVDEVDNPYVDLNDYQFSLDDNLDSEYVDNILLQVAHDNGYGIITNDRLLRMKCREFDIEYINPEVENFVEHKGFKEEFMVESELNDLYQNLESNEHNLLENEYLVIYDDAVTDKLVTLDIFKWTGEYLISLRDGRGELGGGFRTFQFGQFKPRDAHQIMAVDSILNNQLTSVRGKAGTGKSLIALNTAWHLVERHGYKLVIFTNPVKTLNSAELGFYKGDRLDKLMQTVGTMLKSKFGDLTEIERQIHDGNLDILPFSDIRGYDTSGNKTIIWIVEAQNLTSELLKLGLQRVDEASKVIVDGDFNAQVDDISYSVSNGMKRMSEVFRGKDLYGEVELQNVHRSRLADIANEM